MRAEWEGGGNNKKTYEYNVHVRIMFGELVNYFVLFFLAEAKMKSPTRQVCLIISNGYNHVWARYESNIRAHLQTNIHTHGFLLLTSLVHYANLLQTIFSFIKLYKPFYKQMIYFYIFMNPGEKIHSRYFVAGKLEDILLFYRDNILDYLFYIKS